MAAGARIYREITWFNVDWRSEKWAAQKKKFVEYFGSETEWLNLWPIRSYLFANRSLRVIFFFPLKLCSLKVQLLVRCSILLTAHETWWYSLPFSPYGPVEYLVEHQLPYQWWWCFLAFSSLIDGQRRLPTLIWRAGCRHAEPWGSLLQRGIVNHGWTGVPHVPDEAEEVYCRFKTRLRRLKGVLVPLLCHAVP